MLEARIAEQLQQAGVPGASVALNIDGLPWILGVGFHDLDQSRPMPADAVLPIYSVTKVMIAVLILDLVRHGRLVLDEPVTSLLLVLPIDTRITLRHLLNHTCGLADYGGMEEYNRDLRRDPARPWSDAEFIEHVLARGPLSPPGEGWAYSNVGYLLLRQVVEAATGMSFRDALARHIFEPLALHRTLVVESLGDMAELLPGYSDVFAAEGEMADVRPVYHPGWVSHGLVAATAGEVATFLDALMNGRILPPELVADMLSGATVPGSHQHFNRATYGLGLMVDPESRFGVVAGHGGEGPGYGAGAFHFPNVRGRRVTSAALVNRDAGGLGLDLAHTMIDIVDESKLFGRQG